MAFHLASTKARYTLERRAWPEASRFSLANSRRSLGSVAPGRKRSLGLRADWAQRISEDLEEAKAAGERLEELEGAMKQAGEEPVHAEYRRASTRASFVGCSCGRKAGLEPRANAAGCGIGSIHTQVCRYPGPDAAARELWRDLLMGAEAACQSTRRLQALRNF